MKYLVNYLRSPPCPRATIQELLSYLPSIALMLKQINLLRSSVILVVCEKNRFRTQTCLAILSSCFFIAEKVREQEERKIAPGERKDRCEREDKIYRKNKYI